MNNHLVNSKSTDFEIFFKKILPMYSGLCKFPFLEIYSLPGISLTINLFEDPVNSYIFF